MTAATTGGFDVVDYVQVVRLYLGDLDDQARDELTEGLAADLVDLVAEQGAAALPDPESYADELRVAAGLPPRVLTVERDRTQRLATRADAVLDAARARAWQAVDSRASQVAASYALELRPVWWCLRAQVGFWTWQTTMGGQNAVTQLPRGALDLVVWVLLMVLSIRLGRHARHGPRMPARLWLLAANSGVLLTLPYFIDRLRLR